MAYELEQTSHVLDSEGAVYYAALTGTVPAGLVADPVDWQARAEAIAEAFRAYINAHGPMPMYGCVVRGQDNPVLLVVDEAAHRQARAALGK